MKTITIETECNALNVQCIVIQGYFQTAILFQEVYYYVIVK